MLLICFIAFAKYVYSFTLPSIRNRSKKWVKILVFVSCIVKWFFAVQHNWCEVNVQNVVLKQIFSHTFVSQDWFEFFSWYDQEARCVFYLIYHKILPCTVFWLKPQETKANNLFSVEKYKAFYSRSFSIQMFFFKYVFNLKRYLKKKV